MSETRLIHYFQKHIDSLTVTQSLVHWAFPPPLFIPSERDHAVLVALRHSDERLAEADRAGIQAYLQTFDEHHIVQLVSKIKKILHDICLIRLNNEDGDSLYTSYFEHKSHDAFDVLLADTQTGESSKIRLSTEKRKRLNLTNSTKILKIYLSRLKNSQRKRVSKKILSIQSI